MSGVVQWQFDTIRADAESFAEDGAARGGAASRVGDSAREQVSSVARSVDAAILAQLQTSDERALEAIFDRYLVPLLRFADATLGTSGGAAGPAGDIVSDVLVSLWERRATLTDVRSVRSYLYRAVRNRALNHRRGERRSTHRHIMLMDGGDIPGMATPVPHADEQLEAAERSSVVWAAVQQMREPLRTVAVLRWSHGLSFAEIGDVLDLSEASARVHASRALARLREIVPALLR